MNTPQKKSSFLRYGALVACVPLAQLQAAEISKADNTTTLSSTGSWVGGTVPGADDIALWDSTLATNRNAAIGGDLSWAGIKVTNPGGTLYSINNSTGFSLTLGSSGIDMSTATADLTINAVMNLAASQTWTVGSGRTLTLSGANTGDGTITLAGAGGTFALGASSNGSASVATTTGPFGTGTLNLEDGIRLTSSVQTTSRAIRNAINLNGDIEVLMGNTTLTGMSFSGGLNIGADTRTITVTNASSTTNVPTLNFGGTGGVASTVTGSGRLVFENGNAADSPMVYVRSGSGVANDFAVFHSDFTIGSGVTFIAGAANVLTSDVDLVIDAGGFLNTSNNAGSATNQTVGSLSGGGTIFNGTTGAGVATLTIDGGERTIRSTFSGVIQNGANSTSNVAKLGTSTQVFSGANTYTGSTTVTAGTLLINGSHIQSAAGNGYTVNSGATLGGLGHIAGNNAANNANMILVQSDGTLAAGDGDTLGTFTLDGANITGTGARVLNMADGAVFDFTLAGDGSGSDKIAFWNFADGDLLLNDNTVNISLSGPQVSGTYTVSLFEFFSDSGVTTIDSSITAGLILGTLGEGIENASIVYSGDSIDLQYTVAAAIPEPSTAAALLGLTALFGSVVFRRRSNRNQI